MATCEITVFGPDHYRFKDLSAKFGPRAALHSILDANPNVEIDGFLSNTEISRRVDALTFSTVNALALDLGGLAFLDSNSEVITNVELTKALNRVKKDLEILIEETLNRIEEGKNLDTYTTEKEDTNIATRSYVALQNFELLVPRIKEKINNLGINIIDTQDFLEQDTDEYGRSGTREHIYNMSHFERSPIDAISSQIKLYLSTLSKKVKNKNGDIVEVLDDIGMPVPVDFHELHTILSRNLANISSPEDMMEALEELSDINPNIGDIYEDLTNDLFASSHSVEFNGKRINNFKNAFFSAFNNSFHNFLTPTISKTKNADGEMMLTSRIYITNKRRYNNVLFKHWEIEGSKIVSLPDKVKKDIWEKNLKTIFNPISSITKGRSAAAAKRKEKLNTGANLFILNEISDNLELLGISVSVPALVNLRKKMNKAHKRNPENKPFDAFVDGPEGSIRTLAESLWNNNINIFREETTTIKTLAKAEADVTPNIAAESFLNGESNIVYPINSPTAAAELFNDLNKESKEFRNFLMANDLYSGYIQSPELVLNADEDFGRFQTFLNDPFFGKFKIFQDMIKDKGNKIEMDYFDTLYNNDINEGVPFDSFDPASSLASRLLLFINSNPVTGKKDNKYGWFMTPTPSDRGRTRLIKLPKLDRTEFSMMGIMKEGSQLKDWAVNILSGEFERIKMVRDEYENTTDKSQLIENYHYAYNTETGEYELGNGGYFNTYPEFNKFIRTNEIGILEDIDFNSAEVSATIRQVFINQIKDNIDYLVEQGLLNPLNLDGNDNPIYNNFSLTEVAQNILPSNSVNDATIISVVSHYLMSNFELSNLFNGDLAHFKSYKNADGFRLPLLSNANKRSGLSDTPGRKLTIGNTGASPTFRVAILEDYFHSISDDDFNIYSKFVGQNKVGQNKAEKYKRINVTDGQGLASLDRYADILGGFGALSPQMAQTINELKKDEPDWSKVIVPLQPLKGFLQTQRFDPRWNRVMPQVLKYSIIPIVPFEIKNGKNPTMVKIYNKMQESNIDEVVFTSATKYGGYNINTIDQTAPFEFMEMSNKDWRMPQIVPYKQHYMENMGSQIRRNIVENIPSTDDNNYNGRSGVEIKELYQKALSEKLKRSAKKVLNEFFDGDIPNIKKAANKILKDLRQNSYKTSSGVLEQALEIQEDGTTRLPLGFPAIKHQVESSINLAFRKGVTKQNLPGMSAVQYTSLGYNKEDVSSSKTLKYVRPDAYNTKILPAEIIVSPQYFIESLISRYKKTDDVELKNSINKVILQLKSGAFNIKKLPNSLRQVVLYRIPTQGKNSMLPAVIKGFTSMAMGSTIITPVEFITQAGIDYDIDKVYIEIKHFSYENGTFKTIAGLDKFEKSTVGTTESNIFEDYSVTESEEYDDIPQLYDNEIDNTIIDIHYDILTSMSHFKELITPNNVDTLENLAKELSDYEQEDGSKWNSLSTQDKYREINQAGKVFIAIAASASATHSLFQNIETTVLRRKNEEMPKTLTAAQVSESSVYTVFNKKDSPEFNNLPDGSQDIKRKIYTGVGTRNLPANMVPELERVIKRLNNLGYTARTGNADGVDAVFVKNASKVEIYEPKDATNLTRKIVKEIHPNFNALRRKAGMVGVNLMARNTNQVFGKKLNVPSDFVIAYTQDGIESFHERTNESGGTGQAIELASRKGIPVINMALPDWEERLEKVIKGEDVPKSSKPPKKGTVEIMEDEIELSYLGVKSDSDIALKPTEINTKPVSNLGEFISADGVLVSEEFSELVTAAVDNTANPLSGYLNINEVTGSVILYLLESGAGLDYAIRLIKTPIIQTLTALTRQSRATVGADVAFSNAVEKIEEKYSIDTSPVNYKDFDVSIAVINAANDPNQPLAQRERYNEEILRAFLTFQAYGRDLAKIYSGIKVDRDGASQTMAANILQGVKLSNIKGTYFHELQSGPEPIKTLSFNAKQYAAHSIAAYEKYGVKEAIKTTNAFIDDGKVVQSQIIKLFSGMVNRVTEADIRLLMNDFYTYLYMNNNAIAEDKSGLSDISTGTLLDLMIGPNSIAVRTLEANKNEKLKTAEDVSYIPNKFLQNISVELGKDDGFDKISFNNTISKTLSSEQKSDITSEFLKMFTDETNFGVEGTIGRSLTELAQDYIIYNFFTHGFNRGVDSFAEFISPEIYESIIDDKGRNLVEFYVQASKKFNSPAAFNVEEFMSKFLYNRGIHLKSIRDFSKLKRNKIQKILKSDSTVNYFKYSIDSDVIGIGYRTGDDTFKYFNVNQNSKSFIEYHSGNPIQEAVTVRNAMLKEQLKNNVDQNQC